ncbi:MAG: hypothetical protein CSYNP_03259 [Syntrophus sp. SKADARSKE-3]|nr:hypothetical protein [Syntrophus sp. SKADARSKE-3]
MISSKSISNPVEPLDQGFSLMAKPVGPQCNLRCTYCFYREKEALFSDRRSYRMSNEVLEAYIREDLDVQPGPCVSFDWQGGEPTIAGIGFSSVQWTCRRSMPGKRKSQIH